MSDRRGGEAVLVQLSREDARGRVRRGRGALLVTAVSFEQRCVATARHLFGAGDLTLLLVKYDTDVRPHSEDRALRKRHEDALVRLADGRPPLILDAPPYGMRAFIRELSRIIAETGIGSVVIDVTCLTKAHAVAVAAWAVRATADLDILFAYTSPDAYVTEWKESEHTRSWRDVLILPIGRAPRLRRDGYARGLLLAGYEGDRTSVALSVLEPAAGAILIADSPGRPDLRRLCERSHAALFDRLQRIRMPLDEADALTEGWVRTVAQVDDFAAIAAVVGDEVAAAARRSAPIMLYPFGPKSNVLAVALQLARDYSTASWCVYPIPMNYPVDYTRGAASTAWLVPAL